MSTEKNAQSPQIDTLSMTDLREIIRRSAAGPGGVDALNAALAQKCVALVRQKKAAGTIHAATAKEQERAHNEAITGFFGLLKHFLKGGTFTPAAALTHDPLYTHAWACAELIRAERKAQIAAKLEARGMRPVFKVAVYRCGVELGTANIAPENIDRYGPSTLGNAYGTITDAILEEHKSGAVASAASSTAEG